MRKRYKKSPKAERKWRQEKRNNNSETIGGFVCCRLGGENDFDKDRERERDEM